MAEIEDTIPRGRPKDRAKRAAILQAARALFLERGLTATSVEAVADEAGVSKATVYSHFADKEALLRAVMAAESGDYAPPEVPVARDRAALRGNLIAFGTSLVGFLTRPGILDLGRLLINEAPHHPDLAAGFFERGPEATRKRLATILRTATDSRLLACDAPEAAADQLLSMWTGQRHVRQQLGLCPPPTAAEIEAHVRACVDVILRAYQRKSRGRS
jgi:TetR/AcrR family transcriptional repressor of mexJK operon